MHRILTPLALCGLTLASPGQRFSDFEGPAANDYFGFSTAVVGDLTGDGVPELAFGAPQFGTNRPGYVQVVDGARGNVLTTLTGPANNDEFGFAIAGLTDADGDGLPGDGPGDWNGDGTPDLAVGNPRDVHGGLRVGSVTIYSGADLATGTVTVLQTLHGASSGGRFGNALCGAGDHDFDGTVDLLVGEPGSAQARLISGATGADLMVLNGAPFSQFGAAVAVTGDLDFDGSLELLVGAPAEAVSGQRSVGAARCFVGVFGGVPAVTRTYATDGRRTSTGLSVAGLGDLDGDGYLDYAFGERGYAGANPITAGAVRVISGQFGNELHLTTHRCFGEHYGDAIAALGDVDGDGIHDFGVGAPNANPVSGGRDGTVVLRSGASAEILVELHGSAGSWFGTSIAGTGAWPRRAGPDYPGTGLLVGGYYHSSGSQVRRGRVRQWRSMDLRDLLRYGSGCNAGGGGGDTPAIYLAGDLPALGAAEFKVAATARPRNSIVETILIGFGRTALPIPGTACQLLHTAQLPVQLTRSGRCDEIVPLPVPSNPALIGGQVYVQAVMFDGLQAWPTGLSMSEALRFTVR